ncbi:MAG TPA: hypothetical protein VFZ65_20445 [Planctomycetota bacterium]|nr:hypothetical protein [Planctomycetota bacterium]
MLLATRRRFLGHVGEGMLLAGLGSTLTPRGLSAMLQAATGRLPALPADLEALVRQMQELAPDDLMPRLCTALQAGTTLDTLVAAGALANARTFGGGDYEGYHAFMALLPARAMAKRLAAAEAPLPVLKVLYRNTARIRAAGKGRTALEPVTPLETLPADAGQLLRQRTRDRDLAGAESLFAKQCASGLDTAFADAQQLVRDDLNVHRIVLSWRAWDMRQIVGQEHAEELLRQIVRFCIDEERNRVARGQKAPAIRDDLPRLLEAHGLGDAKLGKRVPEDAWVQEMAGIVFGQSREHAADAVAAALAEGIDPDAVAEAISLGANELLLHDTGERRVHGASVGVHASDAANAWRHVARIGSPSGRIQSLVVGAYHTAGQSQQVGRERWSYAEQQERLRDQTAEQLLCAAATAIEQKDQHSACAAMHLYGEAGHGPEPAFALLLRYAVSEDGALHAEKYFHTAREEFDATRPAFRWQRLVALARVTASEFGEPAPGLALVRKLLAT